MFGQIQTKSGQTIPKVVVKVNFFLNLRKEVIKGKGYAPPIGEKKLQDFQKRVNFFLKSGVRAADRPGCLARPLPDQEKKSRG